MGYTYSRLFDIPKGYVLKPCPHCGYHKFMMEAHRIREGRTDEHEEFQVVCLNCSSFGPNDLGVSGAVDMWNMRRTPEEAAKLFDGQDI